MCRYEALMGWFISVQWTMLLGKNLQKLGASIGGRLFISAEWTILSGKMGQNIHGGSSHNWFISTHWTNLLCKNRQKLGGGVFLFCLPVPGRTIIIFAWRVRLLVAKSSFLQLWTFSCHLATKEYSYGLSGSWSQNLFCKNGPFASWEFRILTKVAPASFWTDFVMISFSKHSIFLNLF